MSRIEKWKIIRLTIVIVFLLYLHNIFQLNQNGKIIVKDRLILTRAKLKNTAVS